MFIHVIKMKKQILSGNMKANKPVTKRKILQSNTVVSIELHCIIAFILRLILITYSHYHDKYFKVPYTDVDYKVYTDAARYMSKGKSPYERHTYRYSPLLSILMAPNIYLHQDCGKVFFSVIDILVAKLMRKILICQNFKQKTANFCALLWLYNPLAIVISTRGNADSLAAYLVLWTIYLLQNDKLIMTGIVHGLSIHFRLYPITFSLVMYLYLRDNNLFLPNRRQLKLIISCILALFDITALCYAFYGKKFVDESLIYHLVRKDVKHNFSIFFYMLYLSATDGSTILQKMLTFLPQLFILIVLAVRYSTKDKLPFALFTQAITMVTFNPVMTSQYFFWFLSLLPICLPYLKMSFIRTFMLLIAWVLSQSLWLFAAYLLEFKGIDSFEYIWAASIVFFIVNIKILVDLIHCYKL